MSSARPARLRVALFMAGLVAAAVFLGICLRGNRSSRGDSAAHDSPAPAGMPSASPAAGGPDLAEAGRQHLLRSLDALKASPSADVSRTILADLHSYLKSLPADQAAAAMVCFLGDPVQNAPTRIDFAIGRDGSLQGHPSLRVALLDWLEKIDPGSAGTVAREILASPTDPDEWAVCLRNFARSSPDPEHREFLRSKAEELIRNPRWRAKPSIGYLQSFDVLVHTGATESAGLLAEVVSDSTPHGKAAAHAAYLTLDRLTVREPDIMLTQLAARGDLSRSRGEMVAGLFARADLREPAQQDLVKAYLLDPHRTPAELTAFTGIYPNANFSISRNLLSDNVTFGSGEALARAIAGYEIVNAWVADDSFAAIQPYLLKLQLRLETLIHQSAAR